MKPVGLLDGNYLSQPYLHFYKYLVNVRPIGQTLLDHGLNNICLFLTFHHENLVVTTWCSWWKWRVLELPEDFLRMLIRFKFWTLFFIYLFIASLNPILHVIFNSCDTGGGVSKVPEEIYAIKMIFLVIFWQIWLYNLDPMYIRGLHTDFEVHSIKNQKFTAIFLAAIFLINLKIFLQRVLKTAVTRSILVLLRSGFLQTSYFFRRIWFLKNILENLKKKSFFFFGVPKFWGGLGVPPKMRKISKQV